jgi:hypothetical protein
MDMACTALIAGAAIVVTLEVEVPVSEELLVEATLK